MAGLVKTNSKPPTFFLKNLETTTMLQLADNPQETLTNNIWEQWKKLGLTDRPHALNWTEINNLVTHFLKTCTEKQADYQAFNLEKILNPTLNYYENLSAITEAIEQPLAIMEPQQADDQQFKKEIKQITDTQASILNQIEQIPNLANQIKALQKSQSFSQLGNALKPIVETQPKLSPTKPKPLKPKVKPLDAFAGAMTFLIWLAATYSIISSYGLTAYTIIGVAAFWILFVVVFRLVAGGILD